MNPSAFANAQSWICNWIFNVILGLWTNFNHLKIQLSSLKKTKNQQNRPSTKHKNHNKTDPWKRLFLDLFFPTSTFITMCSVIACKWRQLKSRNIQGSTHPNPSQCSAFFGLILKNLLKYQHIFRVFHNCDYQHVHDET